LEKISNIDIEEQRVYDSTI